MELESEICNFADDTTIYACDTDVEAVMIRLENDLQGLMQWFTNNGMSANPSKFQVMFLGLKGSKKLCLNMNGQLIPSSEHVKLLGVNIDNSLKFETHVKEICKKVNQKLYAFERLRPFLGEQKSSNLGEKGSKKLCLNMNGQLIPSSEHVKLLGVNIDNSLKFETHVKEICKKVNQKLYAFGRLRPFLGEQSQSYF